MPKPKPVEESGTGARSLPPLRQLAERLRNEESEITLGGGLMAIERQHAKGRLTARERIARLIDADTEFFELGIWAGWRMYDTWGGAPAAGVVTGIGAVAGRRFMIIANDATVKAGAFFPVTTKKVLRAQRIALVNRLPLIYLVDSAGVFLPLQDEVFPDEDDFGRIFRNNAVLSALGVPQLAAVMGNCVAGGGYLPVLCDQLVMTDGSGLYLAGPALVKSAIGQEASHEELGGAAMHARVSGTVDFHEPNDEAAIARLRRLAEGVASGERVAARGQGGVLSGQGPVASGTGVSPVRGEPPPVRRPPSNLYDLVPSDPRGEYEVRDVLECLVDVASFDEYKAEYGQTVVCGYAGIGGHRVGVVANQRHRVRPLSIDGKPAGPMQFGGVLYVDSADKATRFVMTCNQDRLPIVFLQDVNGFMVGRDSEQEGIIRAGAKLVNVISNSRVPKITVIVGGSFGAGNYAMCGKAFDPRFIFAWPTARYAVMGADQAAGTLLEVQIAALKRQGHEPDAAELEELRRRVTAAYAEQTDVRYAAARGWVDKIIDPAETRDALMLALDIAAEHPADEPFRTGVLQV